MLTYDFSLSTCMVYNFSGFKLDTKTKELLFDDEALVLTKQTYELLLFFVKNPEVVYSKDEIIDAVWNGKYVTENSIDQSVSKIRKLLNGKQKATYIQTVYGKGFKFSQTVVEQKATDKNRSPTVNTTAVHKLLIFTALIALTLIVTLVYFFTSERTPKQINPTTLMIVSDDTVASDKNTKWLNHASAGLFDQVIKYSNTARIKSYANKPDFVNKQQYLNNQLKISPELKIITTKISLLDNKYHVKLKLKDNKTNDTSKLFVHENLGLALKAASLWIASIASDNQKTDKIETLLPQDSYLVELYLRGLTSYGNEKLEKAEHFFELCLSEKPDFYLARLQLARVNKDQGKTQKALSILATLANLPIYEQIEIEIATITGDIYDTQGKFAQAKKIYLSLLEKYKNSSIEQLASIHYNLAYTYTNLTQYKEALHELNLLQTSVKESQNLELLANVYQKKAGILQKLGSIEQAEINAQKALNLSQKLNDLLGEAKIYTTLASITTYQGKYKVSMNYLVKAININRDLGYKLGVGATINQLIYVLMVQGEFSKALAANLEMQNIAIEIDFNAMLQISKQYAVDIARAQKQWQKAEKYLKEHQQLAQVSNNKSALLKNKLLAIELYLDMGKTDRIKELIDSIQKHIDKTGEIRLQSRINKMLGRYYFLLKQDNKALNILTQAKTEASNTQDFESLLEINNILADYYLNHQQAEKALKILNENSGKSILPYPYLLLKSKAYLALDNKLQAQDLANECKLSANEFWTDEDEKYLQQLRN